MTVALSVGSWYMPAAIPFTDVEGVLAVPGGAALRRAEASQALNGAGPQLVLRDI